MQELKRLDKIAYIRFASVYKNFEDLAEFQEAIAEVGQAPQSPANSNATPCFTAFSLDSLYRINNLSASCDGHLSILLKSRRRASAHD